MEYFEGDSTLVALDIEELNIPTGEFLSIVGRSGSGKTTLLKIIGTLLQPTAGKALINGKDISLMSQDEKSIFRRDNIGFIFQNYLLEERFTVYQNIELALMVSNYPTKERKKKIISLLKAIDLEKKSHVEVIKLSGGEKQRVCIARALVNNPAYVLADEPCGNLDTYNGKKIMELLREISDSGKTVVLVTHNMEDAMLTDRMIELKDGKRIQDEKKRYS